MISLKTSNNIFYNKRVILDYFDSDLFETSREIGDISWLELRISGEDNEEQFEDFLELFITELKTENWIDFFCYERSEKLKNRLRSYGKLFHGLRKEKLVGDQFLVEKELDTDETHSIFAGIIQVDEVDNEIIFSEILGNYFRFGRVEMVKRNGDQPNRLKALSELIDFRLLRKGKFIELDYLVLLDRFVKPTSMIFSYQFDGKDDLVFTIYCGNKIFSEIEATILKSFPGNTSLKRSTASPKEVDRLIDSYFNDWGTAVKN